MISIKDAEEILKREYHLDNFTYLVKDILLPDFVSSKHDVMFNNSIFEKVAQLGESSVCNVSVFEVYLKEDAKNKRVAITQEMFKILRSLRIDNALVSFVNPDKNNYRISLLTSKYEYDGDKIVRIVSNPRRFSYSLGFNTKTKTAYQFLIAKGKTQSIEELIDRFSVEVVNQQFYNEIALCYSKLVGGERDGKRYEKQLGLYGVVNQKKYAEFAVRLIGRITFCWFLKEKKSDNGIPLIPDNYFTIDTINTQDNYYHKILEPLFFELLNTNQKKRKDKYTSEEFKQIPYLNGGLFSPHADDLYKYDSFTQYGKYGLVNIPNDWFIEFYKVLSQYNFTVDENTSYDIELSIDPEMLGRIFENLLAEINPETGENAKKSTGSFYTPRDVVDYMVDSSLCEYLKTKTDLEDFKLKALISYGKEDDEIAAFNGVEKKKIIDALYSITILDPACGSGAFPIGMLQKIVYILQEIDPDADLWFDKATENVSYLLKKEFEKKFNDGSLNYIRKLSVIQNSVFGIDIQPIAVEISRLRCFLSLIIEEKVKDNEYNRGINPLPNLDFKFIIANSLIDLEENAQMSLFEDESHIKKLKDVRDEYFNAESERRTELKLEFKDIQQDMLLNTIANYQKQASKRYQQLSSWKPFENESTNWFDADWMFGIKEGFDLVIGNPPYVDYRKIENFSNRDSYTISRHSKMINLYNYFFEMGLNNLKSNGILTFISPQQYLVLNNTKGVRDLLRNYMVVSLSNFSFANVFDAGTYPFVSIIKKCKSTDDLFYYEFNQTNNLNNGVNYLKIQNPIPEPVILSKYLNILKKMSCSGQTLYDFSSNVFVASSSKQEKLSFGDFQYIEASEVLKNKINPIGNKFINTTAYSENSKTAQINHNIIYTSRMTTDIRAVYIENNTQFLGGKINVILPRNGYELIITALLNSNAVNFWFKERFANTHMQGGALPINAEDLKIIPMPIIEEKDKIQIEKLMKIIYDNPEIESTNDCYKQINELIYKMYNLNSTEINIIEDSEQ